MILRTLVLVGAALLAGCGSAKLPQPLSVANFKPQLLPAMVAKKVENPLYLVVTANDVPDQVHVAGMKIVIFNIPDIELTQVRTFATRDLKAALESHFAHVSVVFDPAQLPATRHLRADVKLTKVEYERRISAGRDGQNNEFFGAIEWAFGIKPSDAPDFVFRFSERTISAKQMTHFDDTSEFDSAFEEALRHVLAEYDRHDVQSKLLAAEATAPANDGPPAATSH